MAPTNPTIITPTVGRVVWFYPATNVGEAGFADPGKGTPLAAIIARVLNESCVNLTVFDANGVSHSRTGVLLVQDGQPAPAEKGHCEWMPFQKGQAKALDAIKATPAPVPAAPVALEALFAARGSSVRAAAMGFGDAIAALKQGLCVARAGWNGKGMFVYINKGSVAGDMPSNPDGPSSVEGVSIGLFERGDVGTVTRMPNINMRAASGATVTGWLASQTDMLAEDWVLVE